MLVEFWCCGIVVGFGVRFLIGGCVYVIIVVVVVVLVDCLFWFALVFCGFGYCRLGLVDSCLQVCVFGCMWCAYVDCLCLLW